MYENFDANTLITPVKAAVLEKLLVETNYNKKETQFLVNGFKSGFDIGYEGKKESIRRFAPNLKLAVGSKVDLWNKVMKEVEKKRFCGPYLESQIPFESFIQSLIGLVPKDGGKDTRLIFHLSYPRDGDSVNSMTPKHKCTVKYPDFSKAVKLYIQVLEEAGVADFKRGIKIAKSDMKSAFRHLCLNKASYQWMLMKAECPWDGKTYFFFDKCLPFGSSISCSHFQRFSNCVAHIFKVKSGGKKTVNYMDDYFFAALLKHLCDDQVKLFLQICNKIAFPVSLEKTVWSTSVLTFLGLLIDTINRVIGIPHEKVEKALNMVNHTINKKKITLKELQKLCGFLNFLCRAVVPGRPFLRRLYFYTSNKEKLLKPHHHIWIVKEIRNDLRVWQMFLLNPLVYARPFMDFELLYPEDIDFYRDASKNPDLAMGGICGEKWFIQKWDRDWIIKENPSIEYLELLAITTGILAWIHLFENRSILLYTDNESCKFMINKQSGNCMQCMKLIRLITLKCLKHNVRIRCEHVKSSTNVYADVLSRLQFGRFKDKMIEENRKFEVQPTIIPDILWPLQKLWFAK